MAIETRGNTRYGVVYAKTEPGTPLEVVVVGGGLGGGTPDGEYTVTFPTRQPTTVSKPVAPSSVELVAANADRKGLSLFNMSSSAVFLSFTAPATELNCWVAMPPGAFMLLEQQMIIDSAIYALWSDPAATGSVQVTDYI